jgi:hypothetical protein
MADAAKIEVSVVYSENADYTAPEWISSLSPLEVTPSASLGQNRVSVTTTAHTIDVTPFNDGTLVIKNNDTDTTDYVTVTYTNLAGTGITDLRVYGKKLAVIPDLDVSAADVTLAAATGPCICDYLFIPHT